VKAALEAGTTRFRPVIMTALAMIIGMEEQTETSTPRSAGAAKGWFIILGTTIVLCIAYPL
jgi:multidrug efflux pump subunit AcrB